MTLLADLAAARGADLSGLPDDRLRDLASKISRGRRQLAAFATAVATEAERRQAAGSSPSPDDLSDPNRDQSTRSRSKDAARGGIRKDLPESGARTEAGEAKTENADHLAARLAHLTDSEKERLAAHDRRIADMSASLVPERFRKWLAKLLLHIADPPDDELTPAERAMLAAALQMYRRPDGTYSLAGSFDGERGAAVDAVVGARACEIANRRPPGERTVTANDRAAALHELLTGMRLPDGPCAGATTTPGAPTQEGAGPQPEGTATGVDIVGGPNLSVGVILDAQTLLHGPHEGSVAEAWDGHPLDPRAAQRLACDADLYTMLYDQLGRPVTVGRARRHATREQRLALRALYPVCPLDGVTLFARCHVHHVNVDFTDGGATDLHNLVPISPAWHHRIHDAGWRLTMDPDRTLHLHRPDGTHDRSVPPPTPITRHGP